MADGRAARPAMSDAALKSIYLPRKWRATRKAVTKKPRRIMPRHRPDNPPPIHAAPIRPMNRMTAEMWKDYRIFKAAGLLNEWRRKWAAYLLT